MKDTNYKPDGTGVVMGDTKAMPNRGTGTGYPGQDPQLDGADTSQDAINRIGSIRSATKSDDPGECKSDDPTFGPAPGDNDSGEYSA